jgi:HEAT repeat protein
MNRRRIIVIGLLLVVLGGLCWLGYRQFTPDPVYQGKRLHVWLEPQPSPWFNKFGLVASLSPEAREAVRQIGTNAIPRLLAMLRTQDSSLEPRLVALAQKQHYLKFTYVDAAHQHAQAALAFEVLGASASNAVPALLQIFENDTSVITTQSHWTSSRAALSSLGAIGPAAESAVPSLVRHTADTDSMIRTYACMALGKIHAQPELAVPALVLCLDDPGSRYQALFALEQFGTDAKAAVPTLVRMLRDTYQHPGFRTSVIESLGEIHCDAQLVVPALLEYLAEPPANQVVVATALGKFGPQASNAVPALRDLAADFRGKEMRDTAHKALKAIEGPAGIAEDGK